MTLASVSITSLWVALGGGELHHGRGRAFWRDGDGFNISINGDKNCWFDHRDGRGGGVLDLVIIALDCDKRSAVRWLQDHAGLDTASRKSAISRDDRRSARLWAITAELLGDTLLETMAPDDPERCVINMIRRIAKAGGAELILEYRTWRERFPELTGGMVDAGRERDKRIQEGLALFVKEIANAA